MSLDQERENALLKATLREILRISDEAEKDGPNIAFEDALEGRLLKEWRSIKRRALSLI